MYVYNLITRSTYGYITVEAEVLAELSTVMRYANTGETGHTFIYIKSICKVLCRVWLHT